MLFYADYEKSRGALGNVRKGVLVCPLPFFFIKGERKKKKWKKIEVMLKNALLYSRKLSYVKNIPLSLSRSLMHMQMHSSTTNNNKISNVVIQESQ